MRVWKLSSNVQHVKWKLKLRHEIRKIQYPSGQCTLGALRLQIAHQQEEDLLALSRSHHLLSKTFPIRPFSSWFWCFSRLHRWNFLSAPKFGKLKNGAYPSQMRAFFKKRKHARKEDILLANLDGISRSLNDFTSGDLIDYFLTQLSNWHILFLFLIKHCQTSRNLFFQSFSRINQRQTLSVSSSPTQRINLQSVWIKR